MKKYKIISVIMLTCILFAFGTYPGELTGINAEDTKKDIEIKKDDSSTHYLKFTENGVEILRIPVFKNDTYEKLEPFFPKLTAAKKGYIKYWGDGMSDYSEKNDFKVYNSKQTIIEIKAISQKNS